jgi:hypothetical protein
MFGLNRHARPVSYVAAAEAASDRTITPCSLQWGMTSSCTLRVRNEAQLTLEMLFWSGTA